MKKLNAIAHPLILAAAKESIAKLAQQGKKFIVLEAAILLEAGWSKEVDEV
jgi:dephospho-CoA kinase